LGVFWKLIDRNFLNPIFNTRVVLRASRLFCSFHCFARAYLQTGYSDMLDISYLLIVILVSEDSNRYAHFFLIEREYFGFNTLENVVVE
jgi:hypothetical protein